MFIYWLIGLAIFFTVLHAHYAHNDAYFDITDSFMFGFICTGLCGSIGYFIWSQPLAPKLPVVSSIGCQSFQVKEIKLVEVVLGYKYGGDYTRRIFVVTENKFGFTQFEYGDGAVVPNVKNNSIMVEVNTVSTPTQSAFSYNHTGLCQ